MRWKQIGFIGDKYINLIIIVYLKHIHFISTITELTNMHQLVYVKTVQFYMRFKYIILHLGLKICFGGCRSEMMTPLYFQTRPFFKPSNQFPP